jgi:hypothetical protein
MIVRAILLAPCAMYFAWLAGVAFRWPRGILKPFGISVATATGASEIRAVYGGFPAAMAAGLVASVFSAELRIPAALAVAAAMTGMAVGRTASAFVERQWDRPMILYTAVEIAIAIDLVAVALLSR